MSEANLHFHCSAELRGAKMHHLNYQRTWKQTIKHVPIGLGDTRICITLNAGCLCLAQRSQVLNVIVHVFDCERQNFDAHAANIRSCNLAHQCSELVSVFVHFFDCKRSCKLHTTKMLRCWILNGLSQNNKWRSISIQISLSVVEPFPLTFRQMSRWQRQNDIQKTTNKCSDLVPLKACLLNSRNRNDHYVAPFSVCLYIKPILSRNANRFLRQFSVSMNNSRFLSTPAFSNLLLSILSAVLFLRPKNSYRAFYCRALVIRYLYACLFIRAWFRFLRTA